MASDIGTIRRSRTLPFVLLLATAASPIPPTPRERAVMDAIERIVVLPPRARPLAAYGRNYAWADATHVVATYLLPSPPSPPTEGCAVMIEDFRTRPCSRREIADIARRDAESRAAETPAGQRRWFAKPGDLPFIFDGGCIQVSVDYDVTSRRITRAVCNGYA